MSSGLRRRKWTRPKVYSAPTKSLEPVSEYYGRDVLLGKGQSGKGVRTLAPELWNWIPTLALPNASFIGKTLWPDLIEAAPKKAGAKTEDRERPPVSWVASVVKRPRPGPLSRRQSQRM